MLGVGLATVALVGCSDFVKKDEFNAQAAQISQLQNEQAQLKSDVEANKASIADLKNELETKLQKYDAQISQLQGRLRVDMVAHFDFNKSELRDQDKPALNDFASVVHQYHPDAVVTVEGFADPAGSTAYNQRLGLRRAKTVRDYLIADGMSADQVRAVSYGKARNRQVVPGAWGEKGAANRRVSLVIDFTGQSESGQSAQPTGGDGASSS
ncbi:MAG: OmpA family protein [Gammaproteobacteria bacterium]|nr:OmpA family protein [Gammaproteobacteria bacterium]